MEYSTCVAFSCFHIAAQNWYQTYKTKLSYYQVFGIAVPVKLTILSVCKYYNIYYIYKQIPDLICVKEFQMNKISLFNMQK